MSSHYLDIHLRPDPEIAPHQLLNSLCARLHKTLVQLDTTEIGIGFPAYDDRKPSLGAHLRLYGPIFSLQALMNTNWLHGLQDHLKLGSIEAVPENCRYRTVSRVQAKSSAERLRRRAMKRHSLDASTAAQKIPDSAEERLRLPFVVLGSRSTGQSSFPLFIRHGPLLDRPCSGLFNSYGLSSQATIPWF